MKQTVLVLAASATLGLFTLASAAPDGDGERRKRRGPPPEAIEACAELALDDACSVTLRGELKEGICFAGPDNKGPLACRPDDAPDHHGPPPGERPDGDRPDRD